MTENCSNGSERYRVEFLPVARIKPSPENDGLYGKVDPDNDETFVALRESIEERGLEEPLILTADHYILSGHRRFEACRSLEIEDLPCRIKSDIRREGNENFMRDLIAYNPQRVKSVSSLLREAILRDSATLADTQEAIRRIAETHNPTVKPVFLKVSGHKEVDPIGPRTSS